MLKRSSVRWLLGLGLGALFVWLATRNWRLGLVLDEKIHWASGYLVGGDLSGSSPEAIASGAVALPQDAWAVYLPGLLPYVFALVAIHYLRVWRWSPLLRRLGHRVPFRVLNSTGAVSFAAIFLFPLRLGEIVRPALLARQSSVKMSEGVALVAVERIFDGLAVALILLGLLFFLPEGQNPQAYRTLYTGTLTALVIFGGGVAALVLAYVFREPTDRMIGRLLGRRAPGLAARVRRTLQTFYRGFACVPDARTMLIFAGTSVVYWGINGVGHYFMARAFGFDVGVVMGFAMMAAVAIGMMIPNAPANAGVFWYCLMLPLSLYGSISGNVQAEIFALSVWFLQMAQMTAFGLVHLRRTSVTLRDVAAATTLEVEAAGAEVEPEAA